MKRSFIVSTSFKLWSYQIRLGMEIYGYITTSWLRRLITAMGRGKFFFFFIFHVNYELAINLICKFVTLKRFLVNNWAHIYLFSVKHKKIRPISH